MRKILILLLLITNSSLAGVIVKTDDVTYQVGETIHVNVSYEVDDPATFTEITDFTFGFDWNNNVADFAGYSFAAPYNTNVWDRSVYNNANTGILLLDDFSVNPFENQNIDIWSLISFEFTARNKGMFDFNLSELELLNYNLDVVDLIDVTHVTAQINTITTVPEPSTLLILTMVFLLVLNRKKIV